MPTLLITGANRGIGLEFVRQYAADGWSVIATVRDRAAAGELLGVPGNVRVEELAIADFAALPRFAESLRDQPLDLFIANAGTSKPERIESAEDAQAWEEMMRVNVIAPVLLARTLAPSISQVASWSRSPARWAASRITDRAAGSRIARPRRR
jgi:NAD(P)-dependent dehydrogenase (short-subunit alcohol dehydrogenase family)